VLLIAQSGAQTKTPSPALLVLNKGANEMAIVDPASGSVVARVAVGEGPHEVVATADGKLAVVSNYGARTPGQSLSVIDIVAQKELRRFDLGALRRPHGLWESGGKIYFTAEANKLVGRFDPQTNTIDWLLGTGLVGTHMVVANKDATRLYTANIGSDAIAVLEARGPQWVNTVVPVGKGPEALDLSPDGRELWTAHSQDGGVSIIDTESKQVKQTLPLGTKRSNRLKFTPDGKRVLISDLGAGEVLVLDAATRAVVKKIAIGGQPEGIQMAPDGSRAYVALAQDGVVAIIDLAKLEVTNKIKTGEGPDGLAWIK
jgi:YVTN family beta-propeller protein